MWLPALPQLIETDSSPAPTHLQKQAGVGCAAVRVESHGVAAAGMRSGPGAARRRRRWHRRAGGGSCSYRRRPADQHDQVAALHASFPQRPAAQKSWAPCLACDCTAGERGRGQRRRSATPDLPLLTRRPAPGRCERAAAALPAGPSPPPAPPAAWPPRRRRPAARSGRRAWCPAAACSRASPSGTAPRTSTAITASS